MIFGVDDAIIASLAGPLLNVLPQLMNAANQKRIQLRQADNQLVGGILSDINKRLLMDKLLEAQQAAQAQGPATPISPEQIQMVADLLAQMPAAAAQPKTTSPAAAAAAPVPSTAQISGSQSVAIAESPAPKLSDRAVLDFAFSAAVEWNGAPKPVFDKTKTLLLRPRLTVAQPAPKQPLPKAILKVVLHDVGNPAVRVEKIVKLTNVLANATIDCSIEPGELAHLPSNTCFAVFAELRWPNRKLGRETHALGSSEIVLVGKSFIKRRGAETSAERELTDMNVYRSFWNKIWEAPTLDGARVNSDKSKYSWELNVNAKYAVVLTAANDSNGIMETKILKEAEDPDSTTQAVRGRMKGGIELSLAELNKLTTLWSGPPVLDRANLEALNAQPFLQSAARELKYNFKLRGRAGKAGMIWVIPTFRLFALTLSSITATDDTGQVTSTSETDVQFPLPVAARLIGLKSAA